MRSADDPDGTVLIYTPDEWTAFVASIKDGEFDLAVLADDAKRAGRHSE